MADFYAALGVPKSASKDEIKKAYRKAALRTHPDRAAPEQKATAEEAFRQVNAAYEILHDDKNRKLYDAYGVWPPPEQPSRSSRSQRTTHDQQPKYPSQPYYDPHHAPPPTFVFTDPFQLFNSMFAEFNHQMNQLHQATNAGLSRHNSAPVFTDPFTYGGHFGGYPAPAAFPSFAAHPFAAGAPPQGVSATIQTEHTFQTAGGGWIKESKVTKVIPSGQRETTIKKTDYNGVVYITRIAGDGTERHFTAYNGVEAPSPHPIPVRAPPPGSAPPPPHRASPSKRPSPPSTGSTAKSSEPPVTPTRAQTESYHHPRPVRAENPVPLMAATYRTASPAPLSAPAGSQGSHGFPFDQPPPAKRAVSPQPVPRVTSPDPNSLRRQATAPTSYQAAPGGPPMPRPQSPHFYRQRVASESVKPASSKLKTSYSMPPTADYASAPEFQTRVSSRAQYAPAQEVRREAPPESGYRSASHSRKSSRSNLAGEYQKSYAYAPPVPEQPTYSVKRSSSRGGSGRERTMDAVFDAGDARPPSQMKHSSRQSVDVKPSSSSHAQYASVPRTALGQNELGLGQSQQQQQTTPSRSRTHTHGARSEVPAASMLFGTPAPGSASKPSRHHSSSSYAHNNPLPNPPSSMNLSSQWSQAPESKRRHQQAV